MRPGVLTIGVDARELLGDTTGTGRYLGEIARRWASSTDGTRQFLLYTPSALPFLESLPRHAPVRQVVVVRRPAAPETPRPVAAATSIMPAAATGSALGMARGASVPPPQPMPVSASQWVASGGGG